MFEVGQWSAEWLQQLVLWLSVGLPGLPPGTTDATLLNAVPDQAILAMNWGGQGTGKAGAEGLPGAVADPELRRAADSLQQLATFLSNREYELHKGAPGGRNTDWRSVLAIAVKYPGCVYVVPGPFRFGASGGLKSLFRIVIVLSPGQDADEVLKELAVHLPANALTPPAPVTNAAPEASDITFQRVGNRLVWAHPALHTQLNTLLTAPADAGQAPAAGSLVNSATFQRMSADLALTETGSQMWFQFSGATVQLFLAALPLPEEWRIRMTENLAQAGTLRVLGVSGLDQGRVVARIAVEGAPDISQVTGLGQPLRMEAFRRVPADADFVAAVGCELAPIIEQLVRRVKFRPADQTDELQGQLETELGLDVEQDVIPAFGTTWIVSSSRSTGGAFGLGPVLSLDVVDPRGAYAAFTQSMIWLQRTISNSNQPAARLTNELFEDRMLYTLQFNDPNGLGLAPCFCITDQELLVTLQPQTMRSHLRFLARGGPSFADRLSQEAIWPEQTIAGLFINAPRLTETIWPLLPPATNAQLNRLTELGLGIDGSVWPSTSAILEHSGPFSASICGTPHGVIGELRNPLSLAAPVIGAAVLWAVQQADSAAADFADGNESLEIDLGAPQGVAPAKIELDPNAPASAAVDTADFSDEPKGQPPRPWLSGLIRAFAPEEAQGWIPPEVLRRIEQGSDPELERARELRREQRRLERERRREQAP